MEAVKLLPFSGGAACALHLQTEQAYRLRIIEGHPEPEPPKIVPATWPSCSVPLVRPVAAGPVERTALLQLGAWSEEDDAGEAYCTAEQLGICISLAARNVPRAAPSLSISVRISGDGHAVETIKFSALPPAFDSTRPLALRGRWADGGEPLPGPPAVCIFVHPGGEAGRLPKRPPSAHELRGGAYEAVAKRHRDFPAPAPPAGPAGPGPPGGGLRPAFPAGAMQAAAEAAANAAAAAAAAAGQPPAHFPQRSDLELAMASLSIAQKAADDAFRARAPALKPTEYELLDPATPVTPAAPLLVRPLAAAVFDSRDSISDLLYRTVAELKKRAAPDGGRLAALDALSQLAHLMHELRVGEDDVPAPEAPPATLFAMHALAEPDEPTQEPPAPWEDPANCGDEFAADVAAAVEALRKAPGPATLAAAEAALCTDALLLSPLVRTYEGRLRLRSFLVALREAAAAFAPVARVAHRLAASALRRLRSQADAADAVLSAWAAVDVLRPQLHNACPDLHLVTLERALRVLSAARDVARGLALRSGGASAAPAALLLAEAVARIGGQEVMDGLLEAGIEHLFEAWSLALRAGPLGSPSRLEATIILYLAEAHGLSVAAFNLAERVYWLTETIEDLQFEARACMVLARLSATAGRLGEAQRHLARAIEIQGQLSPPERERQIWGQKAFFFRLLIALRSGNLKGVIDHAWTGSSAVPWHPDLAHPCRDTGLGLFRTFDRPTPAQASLDLLSFGCYFLALADPHERTTARCFALGAMGELYGRMGHWPHAARATREALRSAARFPRVLPPDHPRVIRLQAALAHFEQRAAARAKAEPP